MLKAALYRTLDQALAFNQRAVNTATNGFDWLFHRESLIKSGQTAFTLLAATEPMSVRFYAPLVRRHALPLVLVPPLGVTANTFDLMPQRSLAAHMAGQGFMTYLVDWGEPRPEHGELRLRDYAGELLGRAVSAVQQHSGQEKVSLMGWCMGGLLALLHTGLREDAVVQNLITVASPIDLRSGRSLMTSAARAIDAPARLIRRLSDFRLHSLDPTRLNVPGWFLALGFKLTDPIGSVTTYWDLLTRLWDREFVENHSTTSDYLNNMLLYPGGVVQDFVVKMAVDNRLAKGEVDLGQGSVSKVNGIQSNLLVFAGRRDNIVPPKIARALIDVVASTDKQYHLVEGGHMGVILGGNAPAQVWQPMAEWLAERS
jgi:polyhydroxyalkanoate synthase